MSDRRDSPAFAGAAPEMSVVLRNDRRELSRLADHVEQFCRRCHLAADDSLNISVVLDELVNNVINYAYGDGGDHEIRVAVRLDAGVLTISIEDDGRAFNPLDAAPPDLDLPIEERPVGGLGIFLVRSMADSLDYRREGGRNVVTATKKVHTGSA